MRLSNRLAVLTGACAMTITLATPTAWADDPPRQPPPASIAPSRTDSPRFERLHLACRMTERNTVHCEWRAPTGANAAKVVLYGSVNNSGRIVLKTLRPPAAGSYNRTIPRRARELDFVLVTFNSAGLVVGRSPVITIEV